MDEPVPPRHRRRERRRGRPDGPAAGTPSEYAGGPAAPPAEIPAPLQQSVPAVAPDAGPPVPAVAPEAGPPGIKRKKVRRGDAERGLRGIVGAGPSQVGVVGAMRARDAARPTAADLAEAERDLVIVRRHYVPPDALPGSRG